MSWYDDISAAGCCMLVGQIYRNQVQYHSSLLHLLFSLANNFSTLHACLLPYEDLHHVMTVGSLKELLPFLTFSKECEGGKKETFVFV